MTRIENDHLIKRFVMLVLFGTLALASDHVSRCLGLNGGRGPLQGGVEYLRRTVDDTLSFDAGVSACLYPGANCRHAVPTGSYPDQRYDTAEAILGVTSRWLNLKYSRCLTDYTGYDDRTVRLTVWTSGVYGGVSPGMDTRGSDDTEAHVTVDLVQGVNGQLHAGYQRVSHSLNDRDYRASATKTLPSHRSATLAWPTTEGANIDNNLISVSGNGKSRDLGGHHWLLAVSKTF